MGSSLVDITKIVGEKMRLRTMYNFRKSLYNEKAIHLLGVDGF
jgi:hypothetical protein